MSFTLAAPKAYAFPPKVASALRADVAGNELTQTQDLAAAVVDADVLYTDTWTSMGQEAEAKKRLADFKGFSIDEHLLQTAPEHAVVLHCLPAHRGEEISDGVMVHARSLVFDQAENRLHAQKAVLAKLLA